MRTYLAVPAAVLLAAGLAACGSDDTAGTQAAAPTTSTTSAPAATPSATEAHNAADVTFAQGMLPHHQGAVEMADLAATRAGSDQVKTLAVKIKAAQQPEIDTMTGWLQTWNEPTTAPGGEHAGHDMSSMPSGMMSEQDMSSLMAAKGEAFDRMFLQMMIEHHQGAVTMAETELREGQFPAAKALATQIRDSQKTEITTMRELLAPA